MTEMQYISVDKIYPHPDNPRKDVGDVSELAASIKESGVLQNLTVVPATEVSAGAYRVVIGHRRLAAAKLAGLETVPCVVSYMTYKQQVATMLAENMQRCDLTPVEQAQGIQMMLDLGEDIKGISDKTGLSETTVRRRVKLMELDQDTLRAAEARGGTLADYAELDTIKDPARRNEVLAAVGTNNFRGALQTARDEEKRIATLDKVEADLKEKGIVEAADEELTNAYRYERNFGVWNTKQPFELPEGAAAGDYRYRRGKHQLDLYRRVSQTERAVNAEAEKSRELAAQKAEENRNMAREITARHKRLRIDWALSQPESVCIKGIAAIVQSVLKWISRGKDLDDEELASVLRAEQGEPADDMDDEDIIINAAAEAPARTLLLALLTIVDTQYWYMSYGGPRWATITHCHSEILDEIYDLLARLGYEMSDEETQMWDGTHPIFAAED